MSASGSWATCADLRWSASRSRGPSTDRDHFASPASTTSRRRPASATMLISFCPSRCHPPRPRRGHPGRIVAGRARVSLPPTRRRDGRRCRPRDTAGSTLPAHDRSLPVAAEHTEVKGQEVVADPVESSTGAARILRHGCKTLNEAERHQPLEGPGRFAADPVLDLIVARLAARNCMPDSGRAFAAFCLCGEHKVALGEQWCAPTASRSPCRTRTPTRRGRGRSVRCRAVLGVELGLEEVRALRTQRSSTHAISSAQPLSKSASTSPRPRPISFVAHHRA